MFDSYARPPLTLAERVRYAQMDVDHFAYEVRSAEHDAGRSRWQYICSAVILGIVSLAAMTWGLIWNAVEPSRSGVAESQGGLLLALTGLGGLLYAAGRVHDETGSWRNAPNRLASRRAELSQANARLTEAGSTGTSRRRSGCASSPRPLTRSPYT